MEDLRKIIGDRLAPSLGGLIEVEAKKLRLEKVE